MSILRRWPMEKIRPYGLVLPSLLYLSIFFAWPMYKALRLSFEDTSGGGFTFANFSRMIEDQSFNPAWQNTFKILIVLLPLQFILALGMALLVNGKIRGKGFLVYVFAVPVAVSDLAAGIVWFAIFDQGGYANTLLTEFGFLDQPFTFLNIQTSWPIVIVVLAELWRATSLVFLILLAGLQNVPKEYDEAAQVFGASRWARLRYITLPILKPSIQVALILRTIVAFQVFAVVEALTGGNLPVLAGESFDWSTQFRNDNVASAYATTIMVISMVVVGLYVYLLREKKAEEMS